MARLCCIIGEETKTKFDKIAQSQGMKPAVYLRNIVQSHVNQGKDMINLKDIMAVLKHLEKSIPAITMAITHVIGRTDNATDTQIEKMTKLSLMKWKEFIKSEEISNP